MNSLAPLALRAGAVISIIALGTESRFCGPEVLTSAF